MKQHKMYLPKSSETFWNYPLGLSRHFIIQPTAARTDLVVDAFDCAPILKDWMSLC